MRGHQQACANSFEPLASCVGSLGVLVGHVGVLDIIIIVLTVRIQRLWLFGQIPRSRLRFIAWTRTDTETCRDGDVWTLRGMKNTCG
jgi:hypothetical protein